MINRNLSPQLRYQLAVRRINAVLPPLAAGMVMADSWELADDLTKLPCPTHWYEHAAMALETHALLLGDPLMPRWN